MKEKYTRREPSQVAVEIFKRSLVVYPNGFRDEYGEEMVADFKDMLVDSGLHPLVDTAREVKGVIFSAPGVWWDDKVKPRLSQKSKIK